MTQMASLLPTFADNLAEMYGPHDLSEAQRMWGVLADLIATVTGLAPTLETVARAGFSEVRLVDAIIEYKGPFALSKSPAARKPTLGVDALSDLTSVLIKIVKHDKLTKPLLGLLHDELRHYDAIAAAPLSGTSQTVRELVARCNAHTRDFPDWEGRPLLINEQRGLLDYMAKVAASEILADCLVDEQLGELLLRASGILEPSLIAGEMIFDLNSVPHALLSKPPIQVCYEAGHAALSALRVFDPESDILDRLYVVEMSIKAELGLDVSAALAPTRANIVDVRAGYFAEMIIDLRDTTTRRVQPLHDMADVVAYEFPDLTGTDE